MKALEKDNSELQHRCEKLETSVNSEKEKKNEEKKLYEERIKDKSSLITYLQDRLQNLLYEMKGDPWYKKDSRKKSTSRNSQSSSDEASNGEASIIVEDDINVSNVTHTERDNQQETGSEWFRRDNIILYPLWLTKFV